MISAGCHVVPRFGRIITLFLLSLVAACSQTPADPKPPEAADALARSLSIVHGATPKNPKVLRVLFYGQSISSPNWTNLALARLRASFPHVIFDSRNLALGGFDATRLERAAERDIADFYPDLIVFHVYGDHRAYERIIRLFRSKTAADIIIQDDHVTTMPEPICDEGIHLRWSPPAGCKGHFYFKQRIWDDFMSGVWLPTMAEKYNLALEQRRARWEAYIKANKLKPEALLADLPHPNERGWVLMAELFTSWFEGVAKRFDGKMPTTSAVLSVNPPAPGTSKRYSFDGNRIELVASGPLDGKVHVRIDGKDPKEQNGCWLESRVSRLPNVPDWPGLSQVIVDPAYHREDRWSVRVTKLDPQQENFSFTLSSSLGGPDGEGRSGETFTSSSGRIKIEPEAWVLGYAARKAGKGVPEGFVVNWSQRFVCRDQRAVVLPGGGVEQRYVAGTGLSNGRHEVEIRVAENAPMIREVLVYRPQLVN